MSQSNINMGTMSKELSEQFNVMATDHAKHLAEYVFIPAYESGFTHGAKHMYEKLIVNMEKGG